MDGDEYRGVFLRENGGRSIKKASGPLGFDCCGLMHPAVGDNTHTGRAGLVHWTLGGLEEPAGYEVAASTRPFNLPTRRNNANPRLRAVATRPATRPASERTRTAHFLPPLGIKNTSNIGLQWRTADPEN